MAHGADGHGCGIMAIMSEFYDVVFRRRDVRGQFCGGVVPEAVLAKVLGAAHAAPSVGLSQPWDFIVVRDPGVRGAFAEHVAAERAVFAASLDAERAEAFARIKVEGVRESALSVVVTYDPGRGAPAVLGRHAIDDAGLYSVCLAIQNLWLAATAEGLGVGWVSFYREEFLAGLLGIPDGIRPVAWLCLGPVTHQEAVPDLERHGWRRRLPLAAVVHQDRWTRRGSRAEGTPAAEGAGGDGADAGSGDGRPVGGGPAVRPSS
jgi:5,6-dimethylbenzimidazole synthase